MIDRARGKTILWVTILLAVGFTFLVKAENKKPSGKCTLPIQKGSCNAAISRWNYACDTKTCNEFQYSGCEGNENNHETQDLCETTCFDVSCPVDAKTNLTLGRSLRKNQKSTKIKRTDSESDEVKKDGSQEGDGGKVAKKGIGRRMSDHHHNDKRQQKGGSHGNNKNSKTDGIEGF